MAGNGAATATAAAKKGTASSKDGAGNGTTAAAAKKSSASSTDGATAASKDGWQRLCCSLQKKTYMVPNKKIKQIISIISLLQTPNIKKGYNPRFCHARTVSVSEGCNPSPGLKGVWGATFFCLSVNL
jgi:hypothetical protein